MEIKKDVSYLIRFTKDLFSALISIRNNFTNNLISPLKKLLK